MRIIDRGSLQILCDVCGVRVSVVSDATATVGFHGEVKVFHSWCVDQAFQFLVASAARALTPVEFMEELLASLELTQEDIYPS